MCGRINSRSMARELFVQMSSSVVSTVVHQNAGLPRCEQAPSLGFRRSNRRKLAAELVVGVCNQFHMGRTNQGRQRAATRTRRTWFRVYFVQAKNPWPTKLLWV